MYFTDSFDYMINSWKYDQQSGKASDPKPFLSTKERLNKEGRAVVPDGSCINEKDELWNTHYFGSCAELYQPGGEPGNAKVLARVELPCSWITCCCLGGPNMDWLFIVNTTNPD